jgi:hypothetical protein
MGASASLVPPFALRVLALLALALLARATPTSGLSPTTGSASVCSPPPVRVLLIIADDVGVDQVGVYEQAYRYAVAADPPHPVPCTPVLDRLAAQGVLFTNAWAGPLCSPTRSQILTGRRASDTGIGGPIGPRTTEDVGLAEDCFTIGDLLEHDPSWASGTWPPRPRSRGIPWTSASRRSGGPSTTSTALRRTVRPTTSGVGGTASPRRRSNRRGTPPP